MMCTRTPRSVLADVSVAFE